MPSLLGDGAAVPSDPTAAHPLVRSQEGEKLSKHTIRRARREFILEFSTLPTLLDCGTTYIKKKLNWNRCESPPCRQCAPKRAADLAAELRALATGYTTLITMTLTISTTPSTPLREAWDALDGIRDEFTKGRWLTSRVDGFAWYTEVTRPSSWHPHINFLLVSRNRITAYNLAHLRAELKGRWSAIAARHGVTADPEHQKIEPVTRTPKDALWYVAKGPMLGHKSSPHMGHVLDQAALDHDAEAAADWQEFEEASTGRRWRNRGGEFRARRAPAITHDPEQDSLEPFSVAWINASLGEVEIPAPAPQAAPQSYTPAFMLALTDAERGIVRSRPGRRREPSSGGQH